MAELNESQKWLYNELTSANIELGTEDEYYKGLSDENTRKWLYDTAKEAGYDMGTIDQFHAAFTPSTPSPAAPEQPEQGKGKSFWGGLVDSMKRVADMHDSREQAFYQKGAAVKEEEKEAAAEQERMAAATLPMSDNDRQRDADMAQLRAKMQQDSQNADAYSKVLQQLEGDTPSYMQGEDASPDDVVRRYAEAWGVNTPEGQQAVQALNQSYDDIIAGFRTNFEQSKRFKDIQTAITQQYRNGQLTKEEADKQLNDQLNAAFMQEYGGVIADEKRSLYANFINDARQHDNGYIKRESERIMSQQVNSLVDDGLQQIDRLFENRKAQPGYLAKKVLSKENPMGATLAAADQLYREAATRMADTKKGEATWGSVLGDLGRHILNKLPEIATAGGSTLTSSIEQTRVLNKIANANAYDNPETVLTDEEEVLYDAITARVAADILRSENTSHWASAATLTADMLPFVEEIMVGQGILGGLTQAGKKAIIRGVARKLSTGSWGRVLGKLAANVGVTAVNAAESAAIAAISPSTYALGMQNMAKVDAGSISFNDGVQFGHIEQQGALPSMLQAYDSKIGELFTETGGNTQLMMRALQASPVGRYMGKTSIGQMMRAFDKTAAGQLLSKGAYNGFVGEMSEECENIFYDACKAAINAPSGQGAKAFADTYGEFVSADTQVPMLISFSIPAILGGAVSAGQYVYIQRKYKTAYEQMQQTLGSMGMSEEESMRMLDEFRGAVYTGDIDDIPATIKSTADAYGRTKDEKERLNIALSAYAEADTQLAALQTAHANEQSRVKELYWDVERAEQQIDGMTNKSDGNIYHVTIKGKDNAADGYITVGEVTMLADSDNNPRFSGNDVVTVRFADGSVQQMAASQLTLIEAPEKSSDRLSDEIRRLEAKWHNIDAFPAGSKVNVNGPMPTTTTVADVNDEGVVVDITDENGNPEQTTIPHEEAANLLEKAEPNPDAVTYTNDKGETMQLVVLGDGVYQTAERDEKGEYQTYMADDLDEMGMRPVGEQQPTAGEEQPDGEPAAGEEKSSVPMDENGNPVWDQLTTAEAADYILGTYQGNKVGAAAYAEDMLAEAKKVQKQAAKQKSKNLNLAERMQEEEIIKQMRKDADYAVSYWEQVGLAIANTKTEAEIAEEATRKAKMQEERQRRKQTEEGIGTGSMAERYNATPKGYGYEGTITLPDGRELKGRYVLAPYWAFSPSHNPLDNFAKMKGYPVTESGESINDRDYTNDKEEQQKVAGIAQNYNANALKNMPVVSDEGLVYNGNGRMMAGALAAVNNTDGAYTSSLLTNGRQYGFDEETIKSMPHSRVAFELDERLPYNTSSLAIFNEQETQTQSNTGKAAGYARKLTPQAISEVIAAVEDFPTIDAFFGDSKAPFDLINRLIAERVIAEREKAEMVDGDRLSATGRERLSNILLGTVFDSDIIHLMGDDAALKATIIRALPQILDNKGLKDFSLESDIKDAIRLLYEVRKSKMPFGSFVRQTVISDDGQVHTAAENYSPFQLLLAEEMINGGVESFRNVLTQYNKEAKTAMGNQLDIFGEVTYIDVLQQLVLQRYGKETDQGADAGSKAEPAAQSTSAGNAEVSQTPIGNGVFGDIYDQFKGKVKEAFYFLISKGGGDLLGVFRREGVGDIDLVWGDETGGLAHIISKHVGEGKSFASVDEAAKEIENIILTGKNDFENGDKIVFRIGSKLVTIRKNYRVRGKKIADMNWVLSAYDELAADGSNSAIKPAIQSQAAPATAKNQRKGTAKNPNAQEKSEKSAENSTIVLTDGRSITEETAGFGDFYRLPDDMSFIQKMLFAQKANTAQGKDPNGIGAGYRNEVRHVVFNSLSDSDISSVEADYRKAQEEYVNEPNKTDDYKSAADDVLKEIYSRLQYLDKEGKYEHGAGSGTKSRLVEAELAFARQEVDTNPTEGQKKAGNYKKGHVSLFGFDITLENPKGSTRSGKDADGKAWSITMQNDYGYIRGTESVDGDHIDIYLGDNTASEKVFVMDAIDQKTGAFDEHKVLLGFDSAEAALDAYLANYEKGWKPGTLTEVSLGEFRKWIESSHRKTKPFAEYKNVKTEGAQGTPATHGRPTGDPRATPEENAAPEVTQNTIFTESAADKARARMRARLGRLNAGLDPEMLSDGIIVAGYYIERGARTFAAYAKAMIKDFGDAIRPYLKGIYTGLSMMPEAKDLQMDDMMTVAAFDVDNFDPDNEPEPPTGGDGGDGGKPASKYKEGDEVTYKGKPGFVVNQVLANGTYALEYLATRDQFMSTVLSGIAEKDIELAEKAQQSEENSPNGEEKAGDALPNEENKVSLQTESENAGEGMVGSIRKGQHTKTGEDLWIVSPAERLSDADFKELKKRARENGGYYSKFKENRGFVFTSEDAANKFNNLYGESITAEEYADSEVARDEGRAVSREGEAYTDGAGSAAEEANERADARADAEQSVEDFKKEAEINEQIAKVDEAIKAIDDQLAILGALDTTDGVNVHVLGVTRRKHEEFLDTLLADLNVDKDGEFDTTAEVLPRENWLHTVSKAPTSLGVTICVNSKYEFDEDDNVRSFSGVVNIQSAEGGNLETAYFGYGSTYQELLEEVSKMLGKYRKIEKRQTPLEFAKEKTKKPKSKKVSEQATMLSLFDDDLEPAMNLAMVAAEEQQAAEERNNNPETTEDNGSSNSSVPPTDGGMGEGEQQTAIEPEQERMGEGGEPDLLHDGERSGSDARQHVSEDVTPAPKVVHNKNNFHNSRGKSLAPTTPKARFEANVAAIRLMRELTESGKKATAKDKAILAQYSGWGGLGTYFNNQWSPEYKTIHELFDADELHDAENSINTAYYTPTYIIDYMWDIVQRMGFKGGDILEGSAGIGNILAQIPTSINQGSAIQAVELDQTTGNILRLLYPDAQVNIDGFQNVDVRPKSKDLVITNVPFDSSLKLTDEKNLDITDKFGLIHNFCIAKNVRALREGGIGVFITTSGTLDKAPDLFKWLGAQEKTDVIGAFRLNNKTFDGAPVTSDIIVVRKRINGEQPPKSIDVTMVHTARIVTYDENPNSWRPTKDKDLIRIPVTYNNYFAEHPEHMGGVMMANCEMGDTFRPKSIGLHPIESKDQTELLRAWVRTFAEQTQAKKSQEEINRETTTNKEGSLLVNSKGEICVSQWGTAAPLDIQHGKKVRGRTKAECLRDYQEVRDALNAVLDYQANNADDKGLKPLLNKLNAAYDLFHKRYGNFHKNNMLSWLRNDVDYSAVAETEVYKESEDAKGKKTATVEKADVLKGRVLRTKTEQKASNVRDGIVVSIREKSRIDLGYIASLLGRNVEDVRTEALKTGLAFEDPASGDLVVKYEYLSGNVLDKLEQAKASNTDGRYDDNVRELERVCPKTIPAHMIKVSFGSTWVPANLYKEYIAEKTGIPAQHIRVQKLGAEWSVTFRDGAEYASSNTANGVHSQKLNMTIPVSRLVIAAINNGSVHVSKQVKDIDGQHTEVDKEATQVCNSRIDEYKDEFVSWFRDKMQADPETAAKIESDYNKAFNQFVPTRVSKEFIPEHFDGANQIFKLNEWQSQAAVRCTMEPLMIAHEVGTGKTFTMITSAMEMRRLGLAKKPMIVVQNATVQQFVADARRLYPRARILSMTDKDKGVDGRAAFYRKIKYNDWDIIIITQSAFNMIPESQVRKEQYIQEKIEEKEHIIEMLEAEKAASSVSDARTIDSKIKSLRSEITSSLQSIQGEEGGSTKQGKKSNTQAKEKAARIESITEKAKRQLARKTDDVESFDDMDIDALFVDEAHEYKHLGFESMTGWGIKGIDKTASGKAVSLYCKMQAVFDKTGHKNVVFATGTPISNTAAEIWTFMKYLMPKDVLKANQIYYFDDFVHNFGKITQRPEFKTNGSFKEVTRFAEYNNVPELVRMWTRCSDTVLEPAGLKDKVPVTEAGGKSAQDIFLPQTRALRSVMKYVRERLEEYENMDGAKKKENSSIPLTMYGIAMRAAIDPRLVLNAADEPTSKTNRAVDEVVKALDDSRNYNGTVAVFCDSFQRKENGVVTFNLFDDIREKLIARGIPAEQIAIISNQSKEKKQQIFDKVNAGEIRVILGSTQKLGVGVNIQTRLFAEIHLDAPNRPMDYQQRVGRIIRQGNLHKEWGIPVRLIRFGVEDSLDVTGYQRLKTKTSFSTAIMKSANDMNLDSQIVDGHENRSMEEDDTAAEFDNMIATISGSEFAILKSDAERKLRKLEAEKKQFEDNRIWLADAIRRNKRTIQSAEDYKKGLEDTLGKIRKAFPDGKVASVKVAGKAISSVKVAEETYKKLNKAVNEKIEALRLGGVSAMQYSGSEYKPLTTVEFELDGVKGRFRVMANVSMYGGSTDVRTYHDVTIPELGIDQESTKQRFIKGDLETVLSWMSGKGQEERIRDMQYRIDRAKKENESHEEKLTRTFDKDADIEKLQADVNMFTEKMKAEMEAKEAKYRELDKEVESVNLGDNIDLSDEEEEDDAEKQYGDGYDNDTEAQQLATDAVMEALENAGINVVLEQESEAPTDAEFSIRKGAAPKKTGIGYKVFYRGKDGKLYPPMVANPNGADTPVGVWLNADAAPMAGLSKTGRPQVKAGGKGTQGGSGQLAYRPGWHLGEIPYAIQFNRKDENGNKTLFPKDFVWAEVEYAADVDYQKDAEAEGVNANGKFQHSLAGLKRVPENGYYMYRTNPNPATDPWIITGAMKVNRVLTNEEVDDIVRKAGREPQNREMFYTTSGTVLGWADNTGIHLTPDGVNPNTPIHEYTHLWAKAMELRNPEGWESIKSIFRDTPFWEEVVNDQNYQNIRGNEDRICSEVLARYSGKRGAERMTQTAQELLDEAKASGSKLAISKTTALLRRVKDALQSFWSWVGHDLFGIHSFKNADEVADRVLYDLVSGTDLSGITYGIPEFNITPEELARRREAMRRWMQENPAPKYQLGETLEHYQQRLNEWKAGKPNVDSPEGPENPGGGMPPVPPVPPVPPIRRNLRETGKEFADRIKAEHAQLRDELAIADYIAFVNEEASKLNDTKRLLIDAAAPIEHFQEYMQRQGATMNDESNAYADTFLANGRVSKTAEDMNRDIIRPMASQIARIMKKYNLEDFGLTWHNLDVEGTGQQRNGDKVTAREFIGLYVQAKDAQEAEELGLPDRGQAGFKKLLDVDHKEIIRMMESTVAKEDIDKLWELINKATKFALENDYEAGRITQEVYEENTKREYYVPQRGWRERDEEGIITEYQPVGKRYGDPYNAALIKAKGRSSLASDPFQYIMSIDHSSIVSSENNKIKQKFLEFCLLNEQLGIKTDAFHVKKYWIMNVLDADGNVQYDADGNAKVELSYSQPDEKVFEHDKKLKQEILKLHRSLNQLNKVMDGISAKSTFSEARKRACEKKMEDVTKKITELENKMQIAWTAYNSTLLHRTSGEKPQHWIEVKKDGQLYTIEVRDEKLANAINKSWKQHQTELFGVQNKIRNRTRWMSAMLTQYNPEFALSNFSRDFQVAVVTIAAEHPEMLQDFLKNFVKCQRAVAVYAANDKIHNRTKYVEGEIGKYLQEYMRSGAPTGYSYMQDLKALNSDFEKMINEGNIQKGLSAAAGVFSMLTEMSETSVRFAGYMTARQHGMGVNEAAYLSKELTTNFDRAGEMANSGWMSWFSFFRATMNGNIKFFRAFKQMPLRYAFIGAGFLAAGILNQLLNPNDPDDEVWVGDYTREGNFVIGKVRIPTAHFLRMFFAAGVNIGAFFQGSKTWGKAIFDTADYAMSEMLPNYVNIPGNATEWNDALDRADFTGAGLLQGFMPTTVSPVADIYFNRDYKGATINREPFAKSQEGTKDVLLGKESTSEIYKAIAQGVYEAMGGDMSTKYQGDDPAWRSWLFDVSPSSLEHFTEGYFAMGGAELVIQVTSAIYSAATGQGVPAKEIPFLRKFYSPYDQESAYRQQYYLLNGRVKEFDRNLKDYKKNNPTKYNLVVGSQQYKLYEKDKKLLKTMKENPTKEDVKQLYQANKEWWQKRK